MNWNDFLPAAVRDMHAHSSEWEEGIGCSESSLECTNAEPTGGGTYENDDFSVPYQTLEDRSSVEIRHYGADHYTRDDVETIFDEEGELVQRRHAKHPPSRPNLVLLSKPQVKKTVSTIRIPFLSDWFDMALFKPTTKKKFTNLLVPMGLPQPPSLLDDEADFYDLPSPPSLVYEYHLVE